MITATVNGITISRILFLPFRSAIIDTIINSVVSFRIAVVPVLAGLLLHHIVVPLNVLHGLLGRGQLQVADGHGLAVDGIGC